MTTILIADSSKSSLVMSSEVFKDKIPGAIVLVAATGKDCLTQLENSKPDMCVVDFDLPDADGISLIAAMRKLYSGPILLTAYPDNIVSEAVTAELFAFNDVSGWIRKPVKFDELSAKIDQFLLEQHRLGRRFDVAYKTQLIGKGAGRGKRSPKVAGKIVNLSLGGVCIALDGPFKMKGGEEITLSISLPVGGDGSSKNASGKEPATKTTAAKGATRTRGTATAGKGAEARLKAKVAWHDERSKTAGLRFEKMSDVQRRGLEALLKGLSVVVPRDITDRKSPK